MADILPSLYWDKGAWDETQWEDSSLVVSFVSRIDIGRAELSMISRLRLAPQRKRGRWTLTVTLTTTPRAPYSINKYLNPKIPKNL